jgi:hypothetical protein
LNPHNDHELPTLARYLLEKTRIVGQSDGERNYHIFYEALVGLSPQFKRDLHLTTAADYFYTNQGNAISISVKDDAADFEEVLRAMQVIEFRQDERECIFRVLSAVLHLGNMKISSREEQNMECATVDSRDTLRIVSGMLGVDETALDRVLVNKVQVTRGEQIETPLNFKGALDTRNALAKALYDAQFRWLVQRINSTVHTSDIHRSAPHLTSSRLVSAQLSRVDDVVVSCYLGLFVVQRCLCGCAPACLCVCLCVCVTESIGIPPLTYSSICLLTMAAIACGHFLSLSQGPFRFLTFSGLRTSAQIRSSSFVSTTQTRLCR